MIKSIRTLMLLSVWNRRLSRTAKKKIPIKSMATAQCFNDEGQHSRSRWPVSLSQDSFESFRKMKVNSVTFKRRWSGLWSHGGLVNSLLRIARGDLHYSGFTYGQWSARIYNVSFKKSSFEGIYSEEGHVFWVRLFNFWNELLNEGYLVFRRSDR